MLLSPVVILFKDSRPTAVLFEAVLKVPVVEWPTNNDPEKFVPSALKLPAAKSPVTVKLSATVVSEVVWPIVNAIPEVSVAILMHLVNL